MIFQVVCTNYKLLKNNNFMKIKNKSFKDKSKKWLKRHVDDEFVQKSITDNYRSRAAYKLIEIIEKYQILDGVKSIIDLGIYHNYRRNLFLW